MKAKSRQSGIIPDPVATLVHEHADTLVQLGHLRHAAESIRANGFSASAFEEIAGTILFIDRELRVHNIKEERYLFPRLREHAEAMIDNLLGDHAKLLKVFDGLTRAIQDMENSRIRDTSVKSLLTSAKPWRSCCTNTFKSKRSVVSTRKKIPYRGAISIVRTGHGEQVSIECGRKNFSSLMERT